MVSLLIFQRVHVVSRGFRVQTALSFYDLMQGRIDILSHAAGIAADIEAGALLKPLPELPGTFDHSVLNVDLLFLISGEGSVELRQVAIFVHGLEFVPIKVVRRRAAFPEEEPVEAFGIECTPLVEKCTEWGYTGSRADHDDRCVRIFGEAKSLVGMDVNREAI